MNKDPGTPPAEDDWHDRAIDAALHELAGRRPPDLSARVLVALQEQPTGELPKLRPELRTNRPRPKEPRRSASTRTLLVAAAFMLLGLAITATAAQWLQPPQVRATAVQLQARVAAGAMRHSDGATTGNAPTGVTTLAVAGEHVTLAIRRGDHIRLAQHTEVSLAALGTLQTRREPTELVVHSMEATMKNGVVAASSLTIGVIAGFVIQNAWSGPVNAGPGEVVRMEAAEDAQPLQAENSRLLARIRDLEEQNTELLTVREELAANKPIVEESTEEPKPNEAEGPSLTFDMDKYHDVLANIDWRTMGEATHKMQPLLAELVRMLQEDGDISTELAVKIQQLNGDLLGQVPELLKADLPGTGTNGAYTHPVVVANVLSTTLQTAGQPLDAAQTKAMEGLIHSFSAELDSVHAGQYEFGSETMLHELETKERFYQEMATRLTPEQFASIFPEGTTDYDGTSLFATGVMSTPFVKPVRAKNAADFARQTGTNLAAKLGLDDANSTKLRGIIESMAGNNSELWRHPSDITESKLNMMRRGRTITALRQQVAMMREISRQIPLSAEQRQMLADMQRILVPLPQ